MLAEERETVIRIGHADGEVSVYSTQKAIWRKMEKAGWELVVQDRWGREYTGDLSCFRFMAKSQKARQEERANRQRAYLSRVHVEKESDI